MLLRIMKFAILAWIPCLVQSDTTMQFCPETPLMNIPEAYSTKMMMNIQMGSYPGKSISFFEAADNNLMKALILSFGEVDVTVNNQTVPEMVVETMIWNPELSGVKEFIHIMTRDQDGNTGQICEADTLAAGSFIEWMFGYTPGQGFPGVASMIHMADANYVSGCPTIVRGIEVITFQGLWKIAEWDADMSVDYYWSNPYKWESSAGVDKSVPVSAVMEGMATIGGKRDTLKITIDYSDFFEVKHDASFYLPPSDLYCKGRAMDDLVPAIPLEFSYTSELILTWMNPAQTEMDIIVTRNEWFDGPRMISRTDYKPLDMSNTYDPFAGHTGVVKQINDFVTGLSYTISKDFGNCTIDYLEDDGTGDVNIHDGHVHMNNPFLDLTGGNKFTFNGMYADRAIDIDAYLRTAPIFEGGDNGTTAYFLSSSDFEVEDGTAAERLIPAKVVRYPTSKYNNKYAKYTMNIFGFSKQKPDFSKYDISACYEDSHKLHIMIRMGWSMDMDIEHTSKLFHDEVRNSVVLWGRVTSIRVVDIKFDIDFPNSAFYLIFTVLDYPPNVDIELNELPDAIRPIKEVKKNLQNAVNKGWFKVKVYKNNDGGAMASIAEPGSLIELGSREGGQFTHKTGYTSGSMAALGIVMLIVTVGGILALLVYVLKW